MKRGMNMFFKNISKTTPTKYTNDNGDNIIVGDKKVVITYNGGVVVNNPSISVVTKFFKNLVL